MALSTIRMSRYGIAVLMMCHGWQVHAEVLIDNAWVREGPPSATVMAGFLTIKNDGPAPIRLIGVSSPQFERVEIHRSDIVHGIARMTHKVQIEIRNGERLDFKPGDYHLMLIKRKSNLRAGANITLVLHFDTIENQTVVAIVRVDPPSGKTN